MSWPRADFHGFLANSCSIGDEKRGNMHRPGHFAADFLQVRQADGGFGVDLNRFERDP